MDSRRSCEAKNSLEAVLIHNLMNKFARWGLHYAFQAQSAKKMQQNLVPGKEKRKNKRHSAGKYQQFAAIDFVMTLRLHVSLL
jgi:hypothetical protein